jgi:hypothetical protein
MTVVSRGDDFEPLLTDERVGKIVELLRIAYPQLPVDTEFFSFVVPPQTVEKDGQEIEIPAQAVFALKGPHPRGTFDQFYKDKELMSNTACWLRVWEHEERQRLHYVSGRDDPAWGPFAIATRNHLRAIKDYKELN